MGNLQESIFYVGNVRQGIYDTITKHIPNIKDEPLGAYHKDTQLAKDLGKLYLVVVEALYKDKSYGDGDFNRDKVPHRFGNHLPETEKGAEPGIIQMFKLPDYKGLRDKVNELGNPDLALPPKESCDTLIVENTETTKMTDNNFKKDNYCIDIETEPFTDSPLKALMLKSVQLDDNFIPATNSNLVKLREELQNKELIVFNAPFEQTQLTRSGFDVGSNYWLDVSLLFAHTLHIC